MTVRVPYGNVDVDLYLGMSIPELIRRLLAAYGIPPAQINNGNCDYFAGDLLFAAARLGYKGRCCITPESGNLPGHVWFRAQGRHFDAATPDGVLRWIDLPIFKATKAATKIS